MGLFGTKEDPEDLMYHAMSLMEKNQPKAAISLFSKVIKQDPHNTSAILNKGLALNQIKKYADAVTCFDALLQINPKDSQAFNNKGIAMAEMGDTQSA
ncbi:MAG: tetratricopeptide repeat protein, partial [Candidatus Nitrosomaritimum yanchengensis]